MCRIFCADRRGLRRNFGTKILTLFLFIAFVSLKLLKDQSQSYNQSDDNFVRNDLVVDLEDTCRELTSGKASKSLIHQATAVKDHQLNINADISTDTHFDCRKYSEFRNHYITRPPVSKDEEEFPLAFSILVHHNFDQLEQLISTIYRPQNFYCIHVDTKAEDTFKTKVRQLLSCFPNDNIFVASAPISVRWGHPSLLRAEIHCMSDLLVKSAKWKYFINLTGEEFMLVTNLELVSILKELHGVNIVDGAETPIIEERYPDRLPFDLHKYKSSTHVFLNHDAVKFILTRQNVSLKIFEALFPYGFLEESFFAILQYNPELKFPGGMKQRPEEGLYSDPRMTRHKVWIDKVDNCPSTYYKHNICLLGVQDLPLLVNKSSGKKLAANKFLWDLHPIAWDCMQLWYNDRVRQEYITGKTPMDISYFVNNSYVEHGRTVPGY